VMNSVSLVHHESASSFTHAVVMVSLVEIMFAMMCCVSADAFPDLCQRFVEWLCGVRARLSEGGRRDGTTIEVVCRYEGLRGIRRQ